MQTQTQDFFSWLLLHDQINTRNMLHRRSMHLDNYNCVLCADSTEETLIHLFWNCPFEVLHCATGITSFLQDTKAYLHMMKSNLLYWTYHLIWLWKLWSLGVGVFGLPEMIIRNDKVFRTAMPHLQGWLHYMTEGLWTAQIRAKPSKVEKLKCWIEQNL